MFRIDPDNPFKGPHQRGKVLKAGSQPDEADVAVLLIHGRGATASNILSLANSFPKEGVAYVAPEASGNTWYPYSFLVPVERNQPGLNSALQVIHDQMSALVDQGVPYERIVLAGFSQGACLASEFAARHPRRYGGIGVLSGGLIGETITREAYSGSLEGTPVFMGCSDVDPHIPIERVHESEEVFLQLNARVDKRIYPGMDHIINEEEIERMTQMIHTIKKPS